jgi:hypothetical protein
VTAQGGRCIDGICCGVGMMGTSSLNDGNHGDDASGRAAGEGI